MGHETLGNAISSVHMLVTPGAGMGGLEVSFQDHVGDFLSARSTTSLTRGLLQEGGPCLGWGAVGTEPESPVNSQLSGIRL